jgi:hypothetical protein
LDVQFTYEDPDLHLGKNFESSIIELLQGIGPKGNKPNRSQKAFKDHDTILILTKNRAPLTPKDKNIFKYLFFIHFCF